MKILKIIYQTVTGYLFFFIKFKQIAKSKIIYFSEDANWAIKFVGIELKNGIKNIDKHISFFVTSKPIPIHNKICHFGSQYMWLQLKDKYKENNKIIVSFLHGDFAYDDTTDNHIKSFLASEKYINKIICSNNLVYTRLLKWGIDIEKICIIPLGVNRDKFYPLSNKLNNFYKKKYNLAQKKFIIGSFQKDGVGWGQGNTPKLIKGPDILCEVLKRISQKYQIHVLLTGPSRGYVIHFLRENNISFSHYYPKQYQEMNIFYNMLDLYLITSREEGGPLSIAESLACGIPLITSNVGMAEDFIIKNENGYIVEVGDIESYYKKFSHIYNLNKTNLKNFKNKIHESSYSLDWKIIAKKYLEEINR